ncbi:hypothetical protein GEOBRER4_n2068 [Citrifermentans bremense]|uniref:Integrase catalytic domain-containing protein n=2 Tax=Citrifermentans bremense TaxID=60035 RepID=A0A6S6LYW2_9BACT|nr:hypothetical protein GEOBRER4_n2068 [Citrifermentans bremense]
MNPEDLDTGSWPTFKLPHDYPKEEKTIYENKRLAVELYAKQGSAADIKTETGFSRSYAAELLHKCLEYDEDGKIKGFEALVNTDRKEYTRTNSDSVGAGSFKQLLTNYPRIQYQLESAFYNRKDSRLSNNKISKEGYYDFFIKLCTEERITHSQYPFNTTYCAKRSLYAYIDELRNTKAGTSEHSSRDAKRHMLSSGMGSKYLMATKPFKQCSLDEHSVDASFCFYYVDSYGKTAEVVLERFMFMPIVDENSTYVLGYTTSVHEHCNSLDISRCLKDGIRPSSREILKPEGIKEDLIPEPNIRMLPELQNISIEELRVDNDNVHLAVGVRHNLKELGIRTNYGRVAFPELRGIIERLFQTLEACGFRQLPGTLGTGPNDPRRETAEKDVRRYKLTYEELLYCLEAAVQWHNRRGRQRNYFESPLQIVRNYLNNKDNIITRIPSNKLDFVRDMGVTFFPTVRGSRKTGTVPYVQFLSGRYTSTILKERWDLIGEKIVCSVSSDSRSAEAYEEKGKSLGTIVDRSSWGFSPMSYEIRQLLLKKKGLLVHDQAIANDARPGLRMNMELKGRKIPKRAARTALAIEQEGKVVIREYQVIEEAELVPVKEKTGEQLPITVEHEGFLRKVEESE